MAFNDSKRRTFHVDWDSPSTETGTVKRRPLSMDIATSTRSTSFENTEYYELKDCSEGFDLRLLNSIDENIKSKTSGICNHSGVEQSVSSDKNSTKKVAVNLRSVKRVSKLAIKKEFGLKLSKDLASSSKHKSNNCEKTPTGIPKPKIKASTKKQKRLVNSSSESSGIGSPLSPLSPQNDGDRGTIINSESKSSGFESPDSPLSPDSQQYAAFYLIQQQLEKLHNCSCERRQAEVCIIKNL